MDKFDKCVVLDPVKSNNLNSNATLYYAEIYRVFDIVSIYIIACNQKTNAVRPSIVTLSTGLHFISQSCNKATDWQSIIMRILVVQAFCSHVPTEIKKLKV